MWFCIISLPFIRFIYITYKLSVLGQCLLINDLLCLGICIVTKLTLCVIPCHISAKWYCDAQINQYLVCSRTLGTKYQCICNDVVHWTEYTCINEAFSQHPCIYYAHWQWMHCSLRASTRISLGSIKGGKPGVTCIVHIRRLLLVWITYILQILDLAFCISYTINC